MLADASMLFRRPLRCYHARYAIRHMLFSAIHDVDVALRRFRHAADASYAAIRHTP